MFHHYNKSKLRADLAEFLQTDPEGFRSFVSGVFAEAGEAANGWICGPPSRLEVAKVPPRYVIRLVKSPGTKLRNLKVIRLVTGLGAKDAHALLHGTYEDDFLEVDAHRIAETLTRLGFTVVLHRVDVELAPHQIYQPGNMAISQEMLSHCRDLLEAP